MADVVTIINVVPELAVAGTKSDIGGDLQLCLPGCLGCLHVHY